MSKEAITKVVQRAISDAGFRRQLSTDPTGALRGFDLSADETAALRAGDAGRLSAMGVDQRMSKAFALGGATVGASRAAGSDLSNASSAMASDASAASAAADARGNALVSDDLSASDAMISDGGASMRGVIPTDPHLRNADADGVASVSARVGDDWKFTAAGGSVAPIEGSPEATAAELRASTGGGMANYPAHDGLAGPSGVAAATASDNAARLARLDEQFSGGSSTVESSAAGSDAGTRLARLDEKLVSEGSPAIDASGGSAGETTAFIDESEGYLTSVGYDPNVSTSAVTDAHDRGEGAISSAVTDAHDRGDVTRIAPDGDDAGDTSAASDDGPNIDS